MQSKPGGAAPRGMHWYYRVNRATNKHCWYLGPVGTHVKSHTATAAVADAPRRERQIRSTPTMRRRCKPCRPRFRTGCAGANRHSRKRKPRARKRRLRKLCRPIRPQPPIRQSAVRALARAGRRTFRKRKIWSRASRRQSATAMPNGATRTRSRKCRRSGLAGKRAYAAQSAAGETALRYFSILGIVVIPSLLAAGWRGERCPASRIVPTCRSGCGRWQTRLRPRRRERCVR